MVHEFEIAGGRKDGLDRPHSVVVVKLRRQLLGAEAVRGDDLDRQVARVHEAVRVEADLGDHRVVGDHHGDGAKEDLEVVGQLRTSGVAGVHRDTDVTVRVQTKFRSLECKYLLVRLYRADYAENLKRTMEKHS